MEEVKKKKSIAELAAISTLSEEELEKANSDAENNLEYGDEDYDEEYDSAENEAEDGENTDETEVEQEEAPVERMEHFGDTVVLKAKPTPNDIYRFMFRHTYFSFIGVVALVMGLGSLGYVVYELIRIAQGNEGSYVKIALFGVVFFMFMVWSPVGLLKKSKKQSEQICAPEGTITYTFSEAGLDLERGEEYAKYEWDRIIKVVHGKTGYYVYLGPNRAFIAPKADLGADEEKLLKLFDAHVKKGKKKAAAPVEGLKTKD